MLMYCERWVQRIPEQQPESGHSRDHFEPEAEPLAAYRGVPAWVLLGEPGSGKTTALKNEYDAMGDQGLYLPLAEFLVVDPLPDKWQGKTLFLDGLDEIRGGTDRLVLPRIANRLKNLGDPPFRLACRAADWRGSSDLQPLKSRSPDQKIVQLELCPLDRDDLLRLLHDEHHIEDAALFIQQAEQYGVHPLLGNPISLDMLVQAVKHRGVTEWPSSRRDIFNLACRQLLSESNRTHRDLQRGLRYTADTLLDSAGELSAVLLLADKQGIATDTDARDSLYPALDELHLADLVTAERALATRLFVSAGVERVRPAHRTIAEYLAAHWINTRLAAGTLSQHRLLGLLLAPDGGLVAGLRGLAAWMAVLNNDLCQTLLKADPFGLIEYGDVRLLPKMVRQQLLQQLVLRTAKLPQLHWRLEDSASAGELASPDLLADFQQSLQRYQHTEASQAGVSAVLAILAHGYCPMPALKDDLLTVVKDARCWQVNRLLALDAWLLSCEPAEALKLLKEVFNEEVQDPDDEILGNLLTYAYPDHLPADELLQYLHLPYERELLGAYWAFWRLKIFERLPKADIPVLLDQLSARSELFENYDLVSDWRRLADKLLIRALQEHGDSVDDARLFRWLGVGTDQYGSIHRNHEIHRQVCVWLSERPERVKAMVRKIIENEWDDNRHQWQRNYQQRLHDAHHPEDMAVWLLSQMAMATDALASACAQYLARWANASQNPINITLDQVLTWQQDHPERAHLLGPILFYELPQYQREHAARQVREIDHHEAKRKERTEAVRPLIPDIRQGTAQPHVYDQLAKLWHGLFVDITGDTPLERFQGYCEIGETLYQATCAGFMACAAENELPGALEIIELRKNDRRHRLDLAALTGAELLWESDPAVFQALSEQRLASLIAMHWVGADDEQPDWWPWCLRHRSELTARVLVDYANTLLKAGHLYVGGTYALAHDTDYEAVARLALPELLKGFPLRARQNQLHHLQYYIQAAQRLLPKVLERVASEKLTRKSLLSNQRPYWLIALMMINPERYEHEFIKELTHSRQRLRAIGGVLVELANQETLNQFSPHLAGQLIEHLMGIQNLELVSGVVQLEHRLGDLSKQLISRLSSDSDYHSSNEIERLLSLSLPDELRFRLLSAQENQRLARREQEYRFLDVEQVSRILHNHHPQNARDLQDLALDALAQVASDLKSSNADTYKLFWDKASQSDRAPKWENDCRDALLNLIKPKLAPFEVDANPEGDHRGDTRSDIQLTYRNSLSLPIEIKVEHSKNLWTATREQLMARYAITPESGKRGIFIAFWFNKKATPPPPGGGLKPKTAIALQQMLDAHLRESEADLVKVVVLDVSWP